VAELGAASLISFIAVLSVNLGLINLFPVPVLDGGHLLFYAAEALHVAGISPRRRASSLGPARAARLHEAIVSVLAASVARRGTSLRDYVDANGFAGDNQRHLHVYGREGEPCPRCGAKVRRLVQGARSTFYCGACQR
jgi:formamidopyrimidine-DNA glycosylase